jgi:hypothetical protein
MNEMNAQINIFTQCKLHGDLGNGDTYVSSYPARSTDASSAFARIGLSANTTYSLSFPSRKNASCINTFGGIARSLSKLLAGSLPYLQHDAHRRQSGIDHDEDEMETMSCERPLDEW